MRTSEELIQIIKENDLHHALFECYEASETVDFPKDYEQVEYICNSDEMYCVIHFKEENIYLQLDGEYDSYGGGDHWYKGNIKEVFPKQVTITVYATDK